MASKSLKAAMNAVKRRAPEKFDEKPLVDIAVRGRDNRFKKSDEKRLVKFVNAIARHSPFGRAVLEDAAKGGYTLIMECQKGTCGYCGQGIQNSVVESASDGRIAGRDAGARRTARATVRERW